MAYLIYSLNNVFNSKSDPLALSIFMDGINISE